MFMKEDLKFMKFIILLFHVMLQGVIYCLLTLCYIDVGKSPRGASRVEQFALHQVAPIIGGNLSHLCICISFGVFVFVFGLFYLYLCISITVWAICFAPQGLNML